MMWIRAYVVELLSRLERLKACVKEVCHACAFLGHGNGGTIVHPSEHAALNVGKICAKPFPNVTIPTLLHFTLLALIIWSLISIDVHSISLALEYCKQSFVVRRVKCKFFQVCVQHL